MNAVRDVGPVRPGDLLAVGLLATAFLVGVAAFRVAPDQVRVHWSAGFEGAYWGVRTLPKAVGLFVAPTAASGLYAVLRAVALVPGLDEELGAFRAVYDAALVLLVALFLGVQLLLVALNLA